MFNVSICNTPLKNNIYKGDIKLLEKLLENEDLVNWDEIFVEVTKDPSLLNATLHDGKTLLWFAAFQIANYCDRNALEFIEKALENRWEFNVEAFPASKEGESVIWLLILAGSFFAYNEAIKYRYDMDLDYQEKLISLIEKLLKSYPKCDLNVAPYEGVYQGVTAALLAFKISDKIKEIIISRPYISYSCLTPFSEGSTLSWIALHMKEEKYQKQCADLLIKMIEYDPNCDVNICHLGMHLCGTPFDIVLEEYFGAERRKLLLYLILMRAQLTKKPPQEIEALQIELKTLKAKNRYLLLPTPNESFNNLNLNIVIDRIWTALPELINYPVHALKRWLLKND